MRDNINLIYFTILNMVVGDANVGIISELECHVLT